MKGAPAVIAALNEALTGEFTAIHQYVIHAKMCQNWGYHRLHEAVHKLSVDEMRHADSLMGRILFLEGVPDVQKMTPVVSGTTVVEQLQADLEAERQAVAMLNRNIHVCDEAGDAGSRDLLEDILEVQERHINWLEEQLNLVGQLGLPNYLAQQVKG